MRQVNYANLVPAAKRLITATKENSVSESGSFRCEKNDNHIYIAALDSRGRALEFVEVLK